MEIIERELTAEEIAEREAWKASDYERTVADVNAARHAAYTAPNGSDAVFMKYQRDEATKQEWLDAKAAIDEANPYPTAPKAKKAK